MDKNNSQPNQFESLEIKKNWETPTVVEISKSEILAGAGAIADVGRGAAT